MMRSMIPGTLPRKKNVPNHTSPVEGNFSAPNSVEEKVNLSEGKSQNDEANKNAALQSPSRRELFAAIIPAFGNGLVKILRESNNLKRDLQEAWEEKNPPSNKR